MTAAVKAAFHDLWRMADGAARRFPLAVSCAAVAAAALVQLVGTEKEGTIRIGNVQGEVLVKTAP